MSRYRIEVARQAEKAILKLPPQVQRRVRDAVLVVLIVRVAHRREAYRRR